jgi:hypothetical protein
MKFIFFFFLEYTIVLFKKTFVYGVGSNYSYICIHKIREKYSNH